MHKLNQNFINSKKLMLCLLFSAFSLTLFSQTVNCENDSTGLIPLNDLGTGFYLGYQGGLFPFGANAENPASTHYKKGKNFAKNIKPLDSLGNINLDSGAVLMAGFGPSIPGHLMDNFVGLVRDSLENTFNTNPCFDAINLCAGGKGLDYAIGPESNKYWNGLVDKVYEKGYDPAQVQIGWMYFNDKYDSLAPAPSFPATPQQVTDDLIEFLHLLMDRFPNMKIMFVSGRHFGGFADPLNEQYIAISEPSSYWNNFSVKWLIERQINGDPQLKYFGAGIEAPFLTWGPYYWTDGNIPRTTDGRYYTCDAYSTTDGYHLTDSTNALDANYLLEVLYSSVFSKTYVKNGVNWSDCVLYNDSIFRTQPEDFIMNNSGITLYPNPATENIYIYRPSVSGKLYAVEIYNNLGQLVQQETSDGISVNSIPIDVADLKSGVYLLRTKMDDPVTGEVRWFQEQFIKQ